MRLPLKVLLVDDQTLVREGIRSLLSLSERVEIVGEAGDGEQGVAQALTLRPDVVLMDIRMPKMNGIEAVEALAAQGFDAPVVMLTTFDDHELVMNAVKSGAKGYLLKDVSLQTLVDAIDTVVGGETLIQPAITEKVLQGLRGIQTDFESFESPASLSEKETEILRLMAAGYSNQEIAEATFKSLGTVKNQVSNLLSKLGVRDRTRAVLKAIETGMI